MDHPLVIIALLAVALAAACLRPGIHEPARAETAPLPIQPHEDLRLPTALPWVPRPDLSAPRAVVSGELSGSCDALEEPGEWDTGQVEHGEELHAPVILGAMDRSLGVPVEVGEAPGVLVFAGGFTSVSWNQGDTALTLVGNLPYSQLLEVAAGVREL